MSSTEGHLSQENLSSRFNSLWRRVTRSWPLLIIILGTALSFAWTAVLAWVVLSLFGL
jgi:hypothetical protein